MTRLKTKMRGFGLPINKIFRVPHNAVFLLDLSKDWRESVYLVCDGLCNGSIYLSAGRRSGEHFITEETYNNIFKDKLKVINTEQKNK